MVVKSKNYDYNEVYSLRINQILKFNPANIDNQNFCYVF